jgi:DNA uptake protein ComE-like DNA-binding protein
MLFQEKAAYQFEQTDFEKKEFKRKTYAKKNYSYYNKKKGSKFKTPPKKFDPNLYAIKDWMYVGMSEKQATLILKFGKRGFYSEEDLKKVFVISQQFFDVIRDSLIFPTKPERFYEKKEFEKVTKIIELNDASLEDLISLKGVGEFTAKNIIKKRIEFGGFISKSQLLEVWQFDQEKFALIENQVIVDNSKIVKIDLNSVTAEELKKHPYLSWNQANSIVKMRVQLGGFSKIEDVKRSVLINEELFQKIKPYIEVK